MTVIAISGSVGSGKTTISEKLSKKIGCEVIHLNDIAEDFKVEEVKELETFDFDLYKLLERVESLIRDFKRMRKSIILEGHFAHFIDPAIVDYLFVINRDLSYLSQEYSNRDYNEKKIKDNLEVEAMNVCFYEALEEGFEEEKQVFCIDNEDLDEVVNKILERVEID